MTFVDEDRLKLVSLYDCSLLRDLTVVPISYARTVATVESIGESSCTRIVLRIHERKHSGMPRLKFRNEKGFALWAFATFVFYQA